MHAASAFPYSPYTHYACGILVPLFAIHTSLFRVPILHAASSFPYSPYTHDTTRRHVCWNSSFSSSSQCVSLAPMHAASSFTYSPYTHTTHKHTRFLCMRHPRSLFRHPHTHPTENLHELLVLWFIFQKTPRSLVLFCFLDSIRKPFYNKDPKRTLSQPPSFERRKKRPPQQSSAPLPHKARHLSCLQLWANDT